MPMGENCSIRGCSRLQSPQSTQIKEPWGTGDDNTSSPQTIDEACGLKIDPTAIMKRRSLRASKGLNSYQK